MVRILVIPLFVIACSGAAEQRHVSTFRMPHGGTCPDDKGCEAPISAEAQYASPDSSRPPYDPKAPAVVDAKPPEPDCALVAAAAASAEVGNYADDAVRAPAVAKYDARCRKAALTLEERQCIVDSHPTGYYWGQLKKSAMLAYCVPRMFPEQPAVQLVPITKCGTITAAVRARFAKMPEQQGAAARRTWEAKMEVLARSCEQDRWTVEYGACVETQSYAVEPLTSCAQYAPHPLQVKIAERVNKSPR